MGLGMDLDYLIVPHEWPQVEFEEAIVADTVLHTFASGHSVYEHRTTDGTFLALKVRAAEFYERKNAEMMQYAATHGVIAPKVRGIYDVFDRGGTLRVVVSERVPGKTLDEVWQSMSESERKDVTNQLREQLELMRQCTLPYIGRPERGPPHNPYEIIRAGSCGPFDKEEEFEKWCYDGIDGSILKRWKCRMALKRRERVPTKFVLTHGDLTPRKIMVEGTKITGIIDWDTAGFFPEYAEYAFNMILNQGMEDWWKPVLEELLPKGDTATHRIGSACLLRGLCYIRQ